MNVTPINNFLGKGIKKDVCEIFVQTGEHHQDWETKNSSYIHHIETESTTEGLQASTNASRPIRFQQSSPHPNLIGLEAFVLNVAPL